MTLDLVTFTKALKNLGPFSPDCHFAVATSGGPDSMALCHLLHTWLKSYPQAQLTALVIDHRLRPESSAESELTQRRLQKVGITSKILTWDGDKPQTRIQERARQARYALLEDWCQRQGVIHLLTGHHGDDQWETIVSRLQKESDIAGLRGILPIIYKPFGRILRPLLSFTKHEILTYLQTQKIDYATDPSNENPKYLRTYLRANRLTLEKQNLSSTHTQAIIKEAMDVTRQQHLHLAQFSVRALRIDPLGYLEVNRPIFQQLPLTLQIEFLRALSHCMATTPYPLPKKKALTALHKITRNTRTTLAGWYIVPKKTTIIMAREPRVLLKTISYTLDTTERQDRFILGSLPYALSLSKLDGLASYIRTTLPQHRSFYLKFLFPFLKF